MPRRARLRLVSAQLVPTDPGPKPLLSELQRKMLRDLAREIEARADAIPDIEPFDPATDVQPRLPRRRRPR
jgi:hypothetical protein